MHVLKKLFKSKKSNQKMFMYIILYKNFHIDLYLKA